MRISIIPARGGSKRIPRKNVKEFLGKPMIAWSIEAAQKSQLFDKIIVSTDDPEIAEIAEHYGASSPFVRPENLSDDFTGLTPVVAHAVEWVNRNVAQVEEACCILATAPFVRAADLLDGYSLLQTTGCNFAVSVTNYAFPIQRAVRLTSSNRIEMFDSTQFEKRSQDLTEALHDAGQFYWGKSVAWLEEKSIFASESVPIILPRYRVQDIDTAEDWERAEILAEILSRRPNQSPV